jgi:methylenetetrahydrofolate dehydrogenase (NADP+)/methenyltetrahydrofolate cyclohydrolase
VDNRFHGILVQLPLPKHIDEDTIISLINPVKDVDGFHPENVGYLTVGNPRFIPCTPKGIMRILSYYDVDLSGKHVVIIGRSNIVGRPVSILTSLKKSFSNATTTICHSGTQDIRYFTNQADVVVTAMGVPNFLDESFIKPGTVLIDVGINRVNDDSEKGYKLVGDIHAESVSEIAGALTPVPGGVGPMTIAMLVENTVEAAEMQSGVGA